MGKPTEKPNYLATVLVKKTRANWYEEPALADFAASCNELYQAAMTHTPFAQVVWPVKDGDAPDVQGRAPAEWRMGQWVLNGSSTTAIEVSINQGGSIVPLKGPVNVKSGDFVMVSTSCAVNSNNPRAVKCYINKVVFMGPGEEIVMGSSVSTSEMMAKAKEKGMNVTGFGNAGAAGFGGFGPSPAALGPTGVEGIGGPAGTPGPTGFGSQTGFGGFNVPGAPGHNPGGPAFGNGAAPGQAPAPVQPPAQQATFAAPAGFNAPTGFPPRQ
jgi:hypothetical protein